MRATRLLAVRLPELASLCSTGDRCPHDARAHSRRHISRYPFYSTVHSPNTLLDTTDALDRPVRLDAPPERIVSLVPSQTELLAHLGLDDQVVGITRFCERPDDWREQKSIVGGTKQVNIDRVEDLDPDLILANHEENTPEDVDALADLGPVYVTDVPTVADAIDMIRTVGRLTDRIAPAQQLADDIEEAFTSLPSFDPLPTVYLIWRDPFMTVGHDTIIHDIMTRGGFANAFDGATRYPEVSISELADVNPDVLLLPDEPFPFPAKEKFSADLRDALSGTSVQFVDGQLFSWYGPRLLETPSYLTELRQSIGK